MKRVCDKEDSVIQVMRRQIIQGAQEGELYRIPLINQ